MKILSEFKTTVCSRNKGQCNGSVGGYYIYQDGTRDKGIDCNKITYINDDGDKCIKWVNLDNKKV